MADWRRTILEKYDIDRLEKALQMISAVYGYYYRAPGYGRITKRLDTIMNKISEVVALRMAEKDTIRWG